MDLGHEVKYSGFMMQKVGFKMDELNQLGADDGLTSDERMSKIDKCEEECKKIIRHSNNKLIGHENDVIGYMIEMAERERAGGLDTNMMNLIDKRLDTIDERLDVIEKIQGQ